MERVGAEGGAGVQLPGAGQLVGGEAFRLAYLDLDVPIGPQSGAPGRSLAKVQTWGPSELRDHRERMRICRDSRSFREELGKEEPPPPLQPFLSLSRPAGTCSCPAGQHSPGDFRLFALPWHWGLASCTQLVLSKYL